MALFPLISAAVLLVAPQPTIGPALLTFAQVAAALSNPSRPVVCDPVIARRAAFVFLKGGSFLHARRAFEVALEVKFKPNGNGFRMVRNPGVVRRERNWRDALGQSVARNFERYAALYLKATEPRPRTTDGDSEEVGTELRSATRAQDHLRLQRARLLDQTNNAASDSGSRSGLEAMQINAQIGANCWSRALCPKAIEETYCTPTLPTTVRDLLRQDSIEPGTPVESELLVSRSPQELVFDVASCVEASGGCVTLTNLSMQSIGDANDWENPDLVYSLFFGTDPTGAFIHAGFGHGAQDWLYEKRQSAAKFFLSTSSRFSVDLSASIPDCLSELVGRWCAATGTEGVMELQPGAEALESSLVRDRGGEFWRLFNWTTALSPRSQWTFELSDGVLIAKNLLAFLDRDRNVPVDVVAQLHSIGSANATPIVTVRSLLGLRRSFVTSGRFDSWDDATYWGIAKQSLNNALDCTSVLQLLRPDQQGQVLGLAPGQRLRLYPASPGTELMDLAELILRDSVAFRLSLYRLPQDASQRPLEISAECRERDPVHGPLIRLRLDPAPKLGPQLLGMATVIDAYIGK